MVLRQTGLNLNPKGRNRPRSVDLDGSQLSVSKIDVSKFGHRPEIAPNDGFEANGAESESEGKKPITLC